MRLTALAFALTLAAGSAFAACGFNNDTVADVSKPSVTAEAPMQTPVPASPQTGS